MLASIYSIQPEINCNVATLIAALRRNLDRWESTLDSQTVAAREFTKESNMKRFLKQYLTLANTLAGTLLFLVAGVVVPLTLAFEHLA